MAVFSQMQFAASASLEVSAHIRCLRLLLLLASGPCHRPASLRQSCPFQLPQFLLFLISGDFREKISELIPCVLWSRSRLSGPSRGFSCFTAESPLEHLVSHIDGNDGLCFKNTIEKDLLSQMCENLSLSYSYLHACIEHDSNKSFLKVTVCFRYFLENILFKHEKFEVSAKGEFGRMSLYVLFIQQQQFSSATLISSVLSSVLLIISKQIQFSSVQLLSCVRLFETPWTVARQASLSITNTRSLFKFMSIESVMPSNHLILCRSLLLPPSFFPSIRVFSSESVLCIKWPKYWSFSFNISPSNEY